MGHDMTSKPRQAEAHIVLLVNTHPYTQTHSQAHGDWTRDGMEFCFQEDDSL